MAQKTDLERLVVSLEASISKYEKAMQKASGVADKRANEIQNRFDKLQGKLSGFGKDVFQGFAAGALGALAPILSVAAAINGAKDALDAFGDIADNSKAAGLDAEFFQGIAYQAQLGGVAFDELSAALATFNKNAGLAVVGKGKMVAALKELNPALLENIRNATTQEQRIRLVADALANAKDASEKAAIATAAFGDAGSKLADVFSGGAAQIAEMQQKARDLGIVVSDDVIARADDLGDEFDTVSKVLDLRVKQALVNLGPILVWLTGLAVDFTSALDTAVDATKPIQQQATATLQKQLDGLIAAGNMPNPLGLPTDIFGVDAAKKREITGELFRRSVTKTTPVASAPDTTTLPTLDETKAHEDAAKAAAKHGEAVKDLISDLQFEQSTIGVSSEQQEILNTLRRAGVDATSDEGRQIIQLVTAINQQKKANDDLAASMKAIEDLAQNFVSGFVDDLRNGKSAVEALSDSFGKLADQLLDMALNQAISSLFSTLFGGGGLTPKEVTGIAFGRPLANGGNVSPGRVHPVGEGGPELFVPTMSGKILSNKAISGGGTNLIINIDAKGAEIGVEEKIAKAIEATVPRMIKSQAPAAVSVAQNNRRI